MSGQRVVVDAPPDCHPRVAPPRLPTETIPAQPRRLPDVIEAIDIPPSSAAGFLLCSLPLTACEVSPPEQPEPAEVALPDTPTDTVADAAVEQEPLPAD